MAKFKKNYSKASASASGGMITKVGIFAAIIGGLFFLFNKFTGNTEATGEDTEVVSGTSTGTSGDQISIPEEQHFLPTSTTGEVIKRSFYTLSYSEKHEQAEWVAYELTKESIQVPNVERTNNFRPDPKVRKGSASVSDYYATGYDRGHLAPAGDMAFSQKAMSETFYMSNMSPQIRNFNGGIWRELEETVRDWAYKFGKVYVVSGPVLTEGIREKIGSNGVSVPDKYYKVILDNTEPERKAIAFIIPNEVSNHPLGEYAVTIDEVEALTGIDFFPILLADEDEERLESKINMNLWKTSKKKYNIRVEKWNTRK